MLKKLMQAASVTFLLNLLMAMNSPTAAPINSQSLMLLIEKIGRISEKAVHSAVRSVRTDVKTSSVSIPMKLPIASSLCSNEGMPNLLSLPPKTFR